MTRKITFVAVFAVALTLAVDSQAFAKGGNKGFSHATHPGHRPNIHLARRPSGMVRHNRDGRFDRRFAYRGWGYGYSTYPVAVGYFGAPVVETPIVEAPVVEAPVVDTDAVVDTPVVKAPVTVAPVVETPEDSDAPDVETPEEDDAPAVAAPAADAEDTQADSADDSEGHRGHRRHANHGPNGGRRDRKTQGGRPAKGKK
jgi:hypothetical protein